MAAPKGNTVKIWRKDLIGTVPDAQQALVQIGVELFGDAVIAVGSPANRRYHGTYEFESLGHLFTVDVRPLEAAAHDA